MKSPVYFASLRARDEKTSTVAKIRTLFDRAEFASLVEKGDRTAIKLHFGETGNDSYISPVFVRQVVDRVVSCGARPFLTDTNTLYLGSRSNAVDHITTAILHGFDYAVAGAPVIIADGLAGRNITRVPVSGKHFKTVAIAGDIAAAQSMIVLTHFKCHMVSGFGGAIKNLGMGCAPPAGKREQHKAYPFTIPENCTACGKCTTACPKEAITIRDTKSCIDRSLCIGCFECMTVCPEHAIDIDWETEIPKFIERMVEYAEGAVMGKKDRVGYMSFVTRITPDCDCVPWSDTPIVPDIGILASKDPVAIDAAAFDLVNKQAGFDASALHAHHEAGGDKFRGTWENTDGYLQVRYAEERGLGSGTYELIPI
ncbi:MAG TPA: DUF362 domain-containing protein [Methanoregulaceae archaeon]|nr:DUF362 domain-containing protein [Methanoregulaceae archaeon]HRY75358.1 DUF362 domain-containing protein [Methanoregulaceae archaeon]